MIVVSIVDERARGVALGAAAYLVKPVGRDDLLAALARLGAPVPDAPETRPRERGEDMTTSSRILVVEDNPKNLKLVRDVLTHFGLRGDRGDLG